VLVVKIVNAESHEGASNGVAYPSSHIPRPVVNTAAGSNGRPGPRAQKVQTEAFDSTPSARIGSS
jgi:hypothetical protein